MEEHKGSWKNLISVTFFAYLKRVHNILLLLAILVWCIPTDIDDLVVLVWIVDWHGHVVVCRNDLRGNVSSWTTNRTTGKPPRTLTS